MLEVAEQLDCNPVSFRDIGLKRWGSDMMKDTTCNHGLGTHYKRDLHNSSDTLRGFPRAFGSTYVEKTKRIVPKCCTLRSDHDAARSTARMSEGRGGIWSGSDLGS